jgi:hypothetical protein
MAHLLAGSDVRYDMGDSHPLSGRLVPDWTLDDGRRITDLLHDARGILLDGTGGAAATAAAPWAGRVDAVVGPSADGPAAMLVRPDGYVAWAADTFGPADGAGLQKALRRWFGAGVRPPSP